ncbi:MAG: alpha-2-macroglobulin family protein [Ignavibacteria bacterium]|nr:alpha-2-macroglobulin family protein [Ignavibacteria bacterium]
MRTIKRIFPVITIAFLLFTAHSTYANGALYDYESKWKAVDSLYSNGLPESAMRLLNEIMSQAKNENNTVNYVRSFIYRLKLTQYNEEDSFEKNLDIMISEEKTSTTPVKQFLNSIIADMYWTYYQQNRYNLLNRTHVVNYKLEDIKTWDARMFIEKSIDYYKVSLTEPDKIQQINIDNFNELLNNYVYDKYIPNGRKYRPTLYDFLAQKAFLFFSNKEAGITRPAEQFLLNDAVYFNDAKDFANLDISTTDNYSFDFYSIIILRDLIKFHLNDADPAALIHVDLQRYNFVYQNSANLDKESIYLKSLESLRQKYSENPNSVFIDYDYAMAYYERGNKYNPEVSEEFKNDKKTAYDICMRAVQRFPEFEGTNNCRSLMNTIEEKSLLVSLEAFNVPGKPFRSLVTYKNVNKLYFKIVETSYDEIKDLDAQYLKTYDYAQYQKDIIAKFKNKTSVKDFSVDLPYDTDLQTHKTEIKVPSLEKGLYVLLTGTDENFSYKENAVSYCLLNINSISYINKYAKNNDIEYYVLDRETGSPLVNAEATVYVEEYNYTKSKYDYIKGETSYTDKDGYFKVKYGNKYRRFFLDIDYDGQLLSTRGYTFGYGYNYMQDAFWQDTYKEQKDYTPYYYTYFFTDRSIYRPGQTIYFKGILLEYKGDEKNIKPGTSVTVQLYDVNYQKVSEQTLITNEFGTINGNFTAPSGGLNGRMHIQTSNNNSQVYFQVEDYKRPKFEVTFEPVKGTYKLGEMVNVKGLAKSYAGANIDNAGVKYRVVRKTYYPRWWYDWYYYYYYTPSSNGEVEITNGTAKTNVNGEFEINFKAIPDQSISKDIKPYFTYEVTADVTDINGETHSKETSISAGYTALILNVNIPADVDKNLENKFNLVTTNLNGQKEPVEGKIVIYKLKSPDKAFRNRLWAKPDKFIYTKDEYYRDFPIDQYDDENNYTKWEKELKALETTFNTDRDSLLDLNAMKDWNQGKYLIEMTAKDKFGEIQTEKIYFNAYSTGETSLSYKSLSQFIIKKNTCEPGENAEFIFGTSLPDAKVLFEVEGKDNLIKREWITINNAQRFFNIPIIESYRGNISYSLVFVNSNRVVIKNDVVSVPHTDKTLDISFETFRDKLLPGENEEWKIKIKGKNGDRVISEMLATMYDASLDAIIQHNWAFNILNYYNNTRTWESHYCFNSSNSGLYQENWNKYITGEVITYDYLNWFGAPVYGGYYYDRDISFQSGRVMNQEEVKLDGLKQKEIVSTVTTEKKMPINKKSKDGKGDEDEKGELKKTEKERGMDDTGKTGKEDFSNVVARKDFRETVFFYPDLKTDENGAVTITFKMPDALTKWKMLGFAHTKDLKFGMISKELITQKELMITPNVPRYFREDDKVTISSKITNLSPKDLEGEAVLQLFDALTNKPVDSQFMNESTVKSFSIKQNQSSNVTWDISIPYGFEAISYKIIAKADNYSDGEESTLPVLSNRMLVTETMPMYIRGNQTKNFTMNKLVNNTSSTLTNYKLTLEFTSNPAWYAIQAMPYLMEYPYECAEQVFSRLYANSIAANIVNSSPKIKEIFDTWKNVQPDALMSNLEKNEELKSLLLSETPWVLEAKNESERKRRIANLFELNIMRMELDRAVRKLKSMQVSNGAWPWFEGMPEDRYITQHIIAGLGKLNKLGIRKIEDDGNISSMVYPALNYMDNQIKKDYDYLVELEKQGKLHLSDNNLSYYAVHYLYSRSFFKDIPIEDNCKEAFDYYIGQSVKYWNNRGWYSEGMIALSLSRFGNTEVPNAIVKSLKENSLYSEELGMYWKDNVQGYYWYEAPIETQALLIEVFDEVAKDAKSVDDMKVWLLKQKQTQDWKTTKATVEAIYALILKGGDWLATDMLVDISLGSQKIDLSKNSEIQTQAGTGYFKTSWNWGDVKPDMGNVTVTRKSSEGISWGSLYWQYYENLDKISKSETNLKIDKKLFLEENTPTGPVITPVTDNTKLKPGDLVKVRIEIRTDRDMEYVHMKDMRAAGFEPVNVISKYQYKDGLGYYESTRDAATNFFFSYLPKGTYVFEYPLRVNLTGDYSNGITSIQCMYAPEFTSNSEGVRVKISNQ